MLSLAAVLAVAIPWLHRWACSPPHESSAQSELGAGDVAELVGAAPACCGALMCYFRWSLGWRAHPGAPPIHAAASTMRCWTLLFASVLWQFLME